MMIRIIALAVLPLAAACTSTPTPTVEQMTTNALWLTQASTKSFSDLALVEAELVRRGQRVNGIWYIGNRSSQAYGKGRFSRATLSSNTLNCSDFSGSWEAQKYFIATGGPENDPHNLDGDGDGLACEWGATVSRIAASASREVRRSRVRPSSRTCYTGPRGGTYTITASGNRNYDGC